MKKTLDNLFAGLCAENHYSPKVKEKGETHFSVTFEQNPEIKELREIILITETLLTAKGYSPFIIPAYCKEILQEIEIFL